MLNSDQITSLSLPLFGRKIADVSPSRNGFSQRGDWECKRLSMREQRVEMPSFMIIAKANVLVVVLLLLSFMKGGFPHNDPYGQKTWCVAKPSSDEATLIGNINFACSETSCKDLIDKGGPCFLPDNLWNHASVAMNLYYQAKGRNTWNCHFAGSGLIVTTDPSYADCSYCK